MYEIIDFKDLFEEQGDELQEALRLHDIENYELMGYDFFDYGKNKKKKLTIKKIKWIILPPGKHFFSEIIKYIRQLKKTKWIDKIVDENRIKKIYKFGSDKTEVIVEVVYIFGLY